MEYAVCIVPAAPIRRHPSHEAEMTSQLLFGEGCEIMEKAGNGFFKIRCVWDGYEGYCMGNQLLFSGNDIAEHAPYFTGWSNTITLADGSAMQLPFGSQLPGALHGRFMISRSVALSQGMDINDAALRNVSQIYLNTPYLWGGRSVFGADCSGFVQMVMKAFGIRLPRDASQQVNIGEEVAFGGAACGDLAFFDVDGRIVHVGIMLGADEIIHAFGKVRKDKLDEKGIINVDTGERTHSLKLIRRLFLIQE